MWGIWDFNKGDWVRELPSKVDDGGIAILAFASQVAALTRAAKHWGYETYIDANRDGVCEVRRLPM